MPKRRSITEKTPRGSMVKSSLIASLVVFPYHFASIQSSLLNPSFRHTFNYN
jgi:hypothetical protein